MGRRRRHRVVSPELIRSLRGNSLGGLWFPEYRDAAGNVRDLSGNGNDGTPTDVTFGKFPLAPGLVGRSAGLNGTTSDIVCGTSQDFFARTTTDNLLWFAWVYLDAIDGDNRQIAGTAFTTERLNFFVREMDRVPFLRCNGANGDHDLPGNTQVPLGGPVFLCGEMDGANERMRLYINGALDAELTGFNASVFDAKQLVLGSAASSTDFLSGGLQAFAIARRNDGESWAAEVKTLTELSGIKNPPAPYVPGSVSAYPTKTTIETAPEFHISSAGEPDPPEIDAGDESPTNLGKMFGPTTVEATSPAAGNQPIWLGAYSGWELVDDWWSLTVAGTPVEDFSDGQTVFAVAQKPSFTGDQHLYYGRAGDGTTFPFVQLMVRDDGEAYFVARDSVGEGRYAGVTSGLDTTKRFIIAGRTKLVEGKRINEVWARSDGGAIVTGSKESTNNSTGNGACAEQSIGASVSSDGSRGASFNGVLLDWDVKGAALSDQQILRKMDELAAKWGIS